MTNVYETELFTVLECDMIKTEEDILDADLAWLDEYYAPNGEFETGINDLCNSWKKY
jgi:hypothetical protein